MNDLPTPSPPTQFWLVVPNQDAQHVSQGLCLQIPTQAGVAGVCQGHQHHRCQQICALGRHKFITQWGTGQIQHQQEVHCIDKLGRAETNTTWKKSALYFQGRGKKGQGTHPGSRPGAGVAPAHTDPCAIPGEPCKHHTLLDDTETLSAHKG